MASSVESSLQPSPSSSATPSTASTELSTVPGAEKHQDDPSKLRMFLGILRKFIGVADIASVRFSLPAQLLEPRPNLEYWTYLDRPEMFIAVGDSEDPLDRQALQTYNSALGEFFRCNWDVTELAPPMSSIRSKTAASSTASSIISSKASIISRTPSATTLPAATKLEKPIRVSYLTEQTSHHPPVSAFYVDCPEKGISARGFDQISAKFTGTSIKVTAGEHNMGIFITLHKRDGEQYQLTHPAAHLGGLLRGSLTVTVGDQCYVTCPKTKLKTILEYLEEGWLGKTQNRVQGVIFHYDPENDDIKRIKDVPEKDIVARLSGNWRERTYFSLGSKPAEQKSLLIDLNPLSVHQKIMPPDSQQLENESVRFWSGVTNAISSKQFSEATRVKQEIEERQREKAKKRQERGIDWKPWFFKGIITPPGRPELTTEGQEVLSRLQEGKWELEMRKEPGAS